MLPVGKREYLEVKVQLPSKLTEVVCDYIIGNIATGLVLEEEDGKPTTGIIFYVPREQKNFQDGLDKFLSTIVDGESGSLPEITCKEVMEAHWVEKYRQGVKPVWIDDQVLIRPPWSESQSAPYEIMIEPKMAFGTGGHGTTRGCLLAISERFKKGGSFLDLGCGSGILSILASLKGASSIKAIDNDPIAIDNCRENFHINQVIESSEILQGSVELCAKDKPYDFVCANIICETILAMLERLVELTKPDGILVLSGLLAKDEAVISKALKSVGQLDFSICRDDNWLTYTVVGN